ETSVSADGECGANFVLSSIGTEVADAGYSSPFLEQVLRLGMHEQLELWVLSGLLGDELQKARLRHHQDVREACLQAAQIEGTEGTICELQRRTRDFGVGKLVEFGSEADLVEDFEGRGMNSVTAEFAVKVFVHFEKGDGNAGAGEEECEHGTARTTADDATSRLRNGASCIGCGVGLNWRCHGAEPGFAKG